MRTLFLMCVPCLLLCSFGCDSADEGDDGADEANDTGTEADGSETDGSSETDGLIMNACGTFDPNEPGDSNIPQDPDDPEIVAACTALCEAQAGIEGCTTTAEACLENCKMRSCDVCDGSLVPLVDCETSMFTGEGCTCNADGIDCPVPAGCDELDQATTACGG